MTAPGETSPVRLRACDCLTPFGAAVATHAALLRGESALRALPVLGREGGDAVPLALLPGRVLDETAPPSWLAPVRGLLAGLPSGEWGQPRRPVFVTSSNFGVGNLLAFRRGGSTGTAHLATGAPAVCVEWLRGQLGWGENVTVLSHACVSAHLGLLQASRELAAGLADEALVFSFDFLSPFVAGGFHALKILNGGFPAPYVERATGAIGLGDGAAYAVLSREQGEFALHAQSLYNEMHHFTANRADGAGFAACLAPVRAALPGARLWVKGHGTGTLEAGRLEARAFAEAFPDAPLAGWKGALGHTLGSCGLVELAVAVASLRAGTAPGAVGASGTPFSPSVALGPIDLRDRDAVVCASNAFGGAHAALVLAPAASVPRPVASAASPWRLERTIVALVTDDAGGEDIAQTRERLKTRFPAGATRRMTQLGLLVGATLGELTLGEDDAVIYATEYGETRALESYLDSFPQPSPTLFQTSIHPSGVQQALIVRQRSVREVFPLAGQGQLPAAALLTALLAPAPRALLTGGEERGTWLLEHGVASDRTFAFALALAPAPTETAPGLGRLVLTQDPAFHGALRLPVFFDALHARRPLTAAIGSGLRLELTWS